VIVPPRVSPLDGSTGAVPGSLSNNDAVVRFDRVTVCLNDTRVLADVSFTVNSGDTIILLGAAGSGKTVLLKTAIGLIEASEGQVQLFGQDITHRPDESLFDLRRRVGMLFQEGALFDSLTVEENVAFPLLYPPRQKLPESEVQNRVQDALKLVELDGEMEKYPSELSGGMRRRVGLARAEVTKPASMLYDSPTAGLDPITAFHIMKLVIRQRDIRNTTSLLVTYRYQDGHLLANYKYDPEEDKLKRAGDLQPRTKFLVLKEGRVVFQGSETELRSSMDPYVARFAGKKVPDPKTEASDRSNLDTLHALLPPRARR
jgi:phospholipid/cholesterol/gamma-HCH transport system ATP-binding protein